MTTSVPQNMPTVDACDIRSYQAMDAGGALVSLFDGGVRTVSTSISHDDVVLRRLVSRRERPRV